MDNNNKIKIMPIITYVDTDKNKALILKDNNRKSGIYRWTNLITNKTYIGSSINLKGRFNIYYSKKAMLSKLNTRKSIIYSAILKHGYANFSLDIPEYCEKNVLIEKEQYYLDNLKPEYNILKIANSRLGSKQSEATKLKISISSMGKHYHFSGKMHTYETRKMISLKLKSIKFRKDIPRVVKPETRLKMSLRSQGVPVKIFDTSNQFVREFPTIRSTAQFFGISDRGLSRYLDNNKPYNGFFIRSSEK